MGYQYFSEVLRQPLKTVFWNRTLTIYCGSGFNFGKFLVPVPNPTMEPVLAIFSIVIKKCTKSCLFNKNQHCFLERCHLHFGFFYFCIPFYVGSRSKSGTGPELECITVPVPGPLNQKVSVPGPVPQHCFIVLSLSLYFRYL